MSVGEENSNDVNIADEDALMLQMRPSADTVLLTDDELSEIDSDKAEKMKNFDDSKVKILNNQDFPIDIRGSRNRATQAVALENFYIVEGLNVRLNTSSWSEHINWLANQIIAEGFREDFPLLVFPTTNASGEQSYGIISGESRYHAALLAKKRGADIKTLPVVLAAEGLSIEEMNIQLATSNTGKAFTPLELALLAQRFSKWQRTPTQIAQILNLSLNYVCQLLKIAKAPNKVRAMIQDGSVPFHVALSAVNTDQTTAVAVLEKGVQQAKAAGKERMTAKFMPENQIKKAERTFAPEMKSVLQELFSNEALMQFMDDETRVKIEDVLSKITTMSSETPESKAKALELKKAAQAKKKADKAAAKLAKEAAKEAAKLAKASSKPASPGRKPATAKQESKQTHSKSTVRVPDKSQCQDQGEDFQSHPED